MRALLALAAVILVITGCGGKASPTEVSNAPESASEAAAAQSRSIYSLAIDPGDGTLLLTAGPLLHRLAPGATEFEQLSPTMRAGQAQGPVKDLVMRFTAPGKLLASGHALRPPLPGNLGLASSADAGLTWAPVSDLGVADYHDIEITGGHVAGLRSDSPGVRVSRNGGRTFETRDPPADSPPIDVAMNPKDPEQMALSSQQGVFVSTNGGRSWRQRDTTFGARLTWVAADELYSAGMDGKVRLSADGGRSWKQTGTIGAGPKEFVAGPKGDLHAVVVGGEIRRSTDGGATWTTRAKLG